MTATSIQTTATPKQTTLYYREGSSDKIYQVNLEANGSPDRFLVRFAFGRRGSTVQTGTKTPAPVDYDTALKTFNQLVASKVAKGYSPGESGTPYQHTGHEGRCTGIYMPSAWSATTSPTNSCCSPTATTGLPRSK